MNIYQLKITLKYSRPPIWRRLQVPADIKLGKLHRVLQIAMGWTDSHLHQFHIGDTDYGVPDPELQFPGELRSERSVPLNRVAAEGDRFFYEYDFGDGWEHEIEVEKVLPAETGKRYPLCLAGKHACPPEDCGGIPGYENLLEVMRDPSNEEYAETIEWLGREFDPEAFDLDDVNTALRRMR